MVGGIAVVVVPAVLLPAWVGSAGAVVIVVFFGKCGLGAFDDFIQFPLLALSLPFKKAKRWLRSPTGHQYHHVSDVRKLNHH